MVSFFALLMRSIHFIINYRLLITRELLIPGIPRSTRTMLNLFSLKNEKQNEASSKSGSGKRASAAQLRDASQCCVGRPN